MQILPTTRSRSTDVSDVLASTASSLGSSHPGGGGLDFDRILQEATNNVPAEVTPVLDAVPDETATQSSSEDTSLSSTDAPYESTADPVRSSTLDTTAAIPASEIRLTDAEVYKIAAGLRKEGVDEETIRKVTALTGHPGGVSVRDVVKAIAQDPAAKLTEGDLVRIRSLADTLDPTGGLGDVMLRDLRSGDTVQAWSNLTQFVNSLPADSAFSIDRDAILSLGKAMRLDEKTLTALGKTFGGNESAVLSPEGIKTLMNPAQKSFEEKFSAQQKLANTLEKVISPVISEARGRLEAEALATAKDSLRAQQSQILIQDTVTKNSFVREGDASAVADSQKATRQPAASEQGAAEGDARVTRAASEQAGTTATSQQNAQKTDAATVQKSDASTTSQAATNTVKEQTGRQSNDAESGNQQGRQQEGNTFAQASALASAETSHKTTTKEASPWEAMLQRLDVVQGPGMVSPQSQIANAARTGQQTALSRSVLSQVESGMMTAMQDGVKRLELQLNPLDMGVVNVVLTTRNGEVTALLRPERPETASLLAQQMEQLRTNLEEQGLKVSKVDVQTQTGNEQGTSWQGTSQHNFAQEQQSRTLDIERFRRMARTRQVDGGIPIADVSPALLSRSAASMGSSLNVVA